VWRFCRGAKLLDSSLSRLKDGLHRGDLSFLIGFAFFRNRYPPSIVVDRLRDHGLMAITARGRKRMTLKGWFAVLSRHTVARSG
jgi:hypothetical protein